MCLYSSRQPQLFLLEGSSPQSRIPSAKHRNSEPEIFTFETIPKQQQSSTVRVRKPRKVMYPSKVKKYLPPAETNPAKRWLVFLCAIVFIQIYSEEAGQAGEDLIMSDHHELSILNSQYEGAISFISAEINSEDMGIVYSVPEQAAYRGLGLDRNEQGVFSHSKPETEAPTSQSQQQHNSSYISHQLRHHSTSSCENGSCNYIQVTLDQFGLGF